MNARRASINHNRADRLAPTNWYIIVNDMVSNVWRAARATGRKGAISRSQPPIFFHARRTAEDLRFDYNWDADLIGNRRVEVGFNFWSLDAHDQ
jgi:hypothetical protein